MHYLCGMIISEEFRTIHSQSKYEYEKERGKLYKGAFHITQVCDVLSLFCYDKTWSLFLENCYILMMYFSPLGTKAYQSPKYLQEF
jgi:hypothetical protein